MSGIGLGLGVGRSGQGWSSYWAQRINGSTFVFDGNSLTRGVADNGGKSYPQLLKFGLGDYGFNIVNYGQDGATSIAMETDAAAQIDILISATKANILFAWEVTNSLYGGRTVQETYNDFKLYCQHRRAAGWKVFALTAIYRAQFPVGTDEVQFNADIEAVNDLMRNNWQDFCDVLIDTRLFAGFNSAATPYYNGSIHLYELGYLKLVTECIIPKMIDFFHINFVYDNKLDNPSVNVSFNIVDADLLATGNNIKKIANDASWNDFAVSSDSALAADGSVYFRMPETDFKGCIVGLNDDITPGLSDTKYGVTYVNNSSFIRVREGASYLTLNLLVFTELIIKITRVGDTITYYYGYDGVNWTQLYVSLVTSIAPLYPCVIPYGVGKEIHDVTIEQ